MAKRSETHVDALIIGGGFSGSLLAMILARRGLRVTLIERGSHPRFAIGESSTPTGSMALRRIADTYDLPMLHPFTSYGDWIIRHPNIACGSKRGFSYFFHTPDTPFEPRADHANELLVAASASEKEADTHWYRADVDHFLFEQARALGATCLEETTVEQAELTEQWNVKLNVRGEPISVRADLTIDASGPDSVMSRVLGIREHPEGMRTHSRATFGHFRNVKMWHETCPSLKIDDHPFPCDDAALHHILDDGWMWNLRFDNGITSAGFMTTTNETVDHHDVEPEREFCERLQRYPSIASAFASAEATRPVVTTRPLQFRRARTAASTWLLLPAAAYFLDPLHSTGIAHSLCCVERAAEWALATSRHRPPLAETYDAQMQSEIDLLDQIVHAGYLTLKSPEQFMQSAMLYFLGATFSEHASRATPPIATSFLHLSDPTFADLIRQHHGVIANDRENVQNSADANAFASRVRAYNRVGLCDPSRNNMYPFQ